MNGPKIASAPARVGPKDESAPEAIRRLDIAATVIEVTRREGSIVETRRSKDPISRTIEDAMALACTADLPAEVARRVVPGLCREALEAADTFRAVKEGSHDALPDPMIDLVKSAEKLARWLVTPS
jgi:hypothetical protein